MKVSKKLKPPIPVGMQIYDRGEVAGIHHRKAAATKFIRGKEQQLVFLREPTNKHDSNAIQVIGSVKGLLGRKRLFIGYVPAEIAKKLVSTGVLGSVVPRLRHLKLDGDYITVSFEILGPKSTIEQYRPKTPKKKKSPQQKQSASDLVFTGVYEIVDDSYPEYDSKKVSKALFNEVFPEFLDKALTKMNISKEQFSKLKEGDNVLDDIEDIIIDMIDEIFIGFLRSSLNWKKSTNVV